MPVQLRVPLPPGRQLRVPPRHPALVVQPQQGLRPAIPPLSAQLPELLLQEWALHAGLAQARRLQVFGNL